MGWSRLRGGGRAVLAEDGYPLSVARGGQPFQRGQPRCRLDHESAAIKGEKSRKGETQSKHTQLRRMEG